MPPPPPFNRYIPVKTLPSASSGMPSVKKRVMQECWAKICLLNFIFVKAPIFLVFSVLFQKNPLFDILNIKRVKLIENVLLTFLNRISY